MKNRYLLLRNHLILRDDPALTPELWHDLYTTGFGLVVFATGNRLPFLPAQITLLQQSFIEQNIPFPEEFEPAKLETQLTRLLNRNRLLKGSRIHLLVFADNSGYLAYTTEVPDYFPLNQKGYLIRLTESGTPSGKHGTANWITWSIEHYFSENHKPDEPDIITIFTDPKDHISGSDRGDLMLRLENQWFLVSGEQSPDRQVITRWIQEWCIQKSIPFSESGELSARVLADAEEVLLINDTLGIQWILGYGSKRYYRKTAREWSEALTRFIQSGDQFHIGSSG